MWKSDNMTEEMVPDYDVITRAQHTAEPLDTCGSFAWVCQ